MSAPLFAFLVSLFAGLSTALGGLVPLMRKKVGPLFLCFSLGLSAGVMVYISFMEMLPEAFEGLQELYGKRIGGLACLGLFLAGMFLIALIDRLVPEDRNPHEFGHEESGSLSKMGVLSALAIAVHNFPEGLASFMSALADPVGGISIAVAIALHNIPEGITVATPIYASTGKKGRAFALTLVSGLAEPLGALAGFFLLSHILSPVAFAAVYALVAGIMVYLAFDELLPTAENYGHHHLVTYAVILGMMLMGLTLVLL